MVLVASDITSMRLAVKSATYSTPRGSSSATSEAAPPIDTTFPNVPAITASPSRNALNAAKQSFRSIPDSIPLPRSLSSPAAAPHRFVTSAACRAVQFLLSCRSQITWLPAAWFSVVPPARGWPDEVHPARHRSNSRSKAARYSTFFLRRRKMIPRNRTAKTAQTTRTVEASNIALSPFLTRINSTSLALSFRQVLELVHHGYQFTDNLHRHRPHRDQKQRRYN